MSGQIDLKEAEIKEHVRTRAKQWFGIELHDDNMAECAKLIKNIEYDKNGKPRSRQAMRKLIRKR